MQQQGLSPPLFGSEKWATEYVQAQAYKEFWHGHQQAQPHPNHQQDGGHIACASAKLFADMHRAPWAVSHGRT